eukprot:gene7438-10056_t
MVPLALFSKDSASGGQWRKYGRAAWLSYRAAVWKR